MDCKLSLTTCNPRYSWGLTYQQYDDPKQAQALKDVLTQGQTMSLELGYVPIPEAIVKKATEALDKIGISKK